MTSRQSHPPPEELSDLLRLLKTGHLDEWAPTASALLDWSRYRADPVPAERLAADVRRTIAYMPESEARDLRQLIPADAHKATSQRSRWEPIRGGDSGTALKWRGMFIVTRLLEELRKLEDIDVLSNPPGCRILSLESTLRLSGQQFQTRTLTITYELCSTRDDFRVYTFNRVGKLRPKVIAGDAQVVGSVPVDSGGLGKGRRLWAVYLGRSVPRDAIVSFTLRWTFKENPEADPWAGFGARYDIGTVLLNADVPTSLASHYDRVEYDGMYPFAKELEREPVDRSDDSPMTYRINRFTPFHYYQLVWRR